MPGDHPPRQFCRAGRAGVGQVPGRDLDAGQYETRALAARVSGPGTRLAMLFNFYLGNHDAGGLKAMPDLLLPIYHGLAEAGHRVIGYGAALMPLPAVNVLVEFFPDESFVDQLVKTKERIGDKFVFG